MTLNNKGPSKIVLKCPHCGAVYAEVDEDSEFMRGYTLGYEAGEVIEKLKKDGDVEASHQ